MNGKEKGRVGNSRAGNPLIVNLICFWPLSAKVSKIQRLRRGIIMILLDTHENFSTTYVKCAILRIERGRERDLLILDADRMLAERTIRLVGGHCWTLLEFLVPWQNSTTG
ncbi:uncharacterized protein LOC122497986 [Leptopilina heterotoma]|uniref:uncharacterized protein LOC122497986 n=1 Tax=Leptopilina heterotoma TaxID=63436 RepID=UPI001CA92F9F|nr:uncharacterized protein LOC122497986 [Leptopilina heterotoma]